MDRRRFLSSLPALPALVASAPAVPAEDPELLVQGKRVRALLATAERAYAQAHDLIHSPWRHNEARPLLKQVLEAAAEAWFAARGVETKTMPHYDWHFMAQSRPDAITGIGWRAAHLALCATREYCDFSSIFYSKELGAQGSAKLITRSRELLRRALISVAQCIEGVRREAILRVFAGNTRIA